MKKNIKKTIAIIQARMASTRLPGKVLMSIEGKPMLWHVIERVKRSKKINSIVVATTSKDEDRAIIKLAKKCRVGIFSGNENDVLDTYYQAAKRFKADIVARITADCPLIDSKTVDLVVEKHLDSKADYTSNTLKRIFSRGLDVEVFNFNVLEQTYKETKEPYQREHVTPYIYEHPEIFKLQNIEAKGKLKRPDLRLTVDTIEDLRLVRKIYKHLYIPGKIFYTEEIIDLLNKYPELIKINTDVQQKNLKE